MSILEQAAQHVLVRAELAHVVRNRAALVGQSGDIQGSIDAYKKCISDFPAHVPSYVSLSRLYVNEGKHDLAKGVVDEGMNYVGYDESFSSNALELNRYQRLLSQDNENNTSESSGAGMQVGMNLVLSIAQNALAEEDFALLLAQVQEKFSDQDSSGA